MKLCIASNSGFKPDSIAHLSSLSHTHLMLQKMWFYFVVVQIDGYVMETKISKGIWIPRMVKNTCSQISQ